MPSTFTQSIRFEAPPGDLYALYADSRLHAEATGAGADMSDRPGAAFTAWDGYIGGVTLHARKGRLIVQTWRASDWRGDAPDSILVLLFLVEDGGTRLLVTHANVPDDQAAELKKGWRDYYWKPWKAWLAARARNSAPPRPAARTGGAARSATRARPGSAARPGRSRRG